RGAVQVAAAAGLRLADLDDYRAPGSAEPALVLGYGNISDTEIPPAVALLREALRSPTTSPPTRTAQLSLRIDDTGFMAGIGLSQVL
ncbi:hypothetical protein ABT086_16450, partial [Streptomyces mirabilis]